MDRQGVGPPALVSDGVQPLPDLPHHVRHQVGLLPSLPHGEVDPHAVEVQLVAVEIVSRGGLRDVVETMLPDLRVGVVERHPETLLGQFGRELAVRHRRHQQLRMLRLVDVVQFLQGP